METPNLNLSPSKLSPEVRLSVRALRSCGSLLAPVKADSGGFRIRTWGLGLRIWIWGYRVFLNSGLEGYVI